MYPEEILSEDYDNGTMPHNVAALRESVVGHRIVSAQKEIVTINRWGYPEESYGLVLTLDNGKQVVLQDTDDCCAYTALDDFLLHPELIDHVITGVGTTGYYTRWHIYADMGDVLELEVGWSSGNPFYYGYGFSIDVVDSTDPGE